MTDDWLEQALARHGETPVADAGFTLRVMHALPARADERFGSRSDWIVIGATAGAAAVVAAQFPLAPFIRLAVESAQIPWIGGILMLGCMAGALLADPIRRAL